MKILIAFGLLTLFSCQVKTKDKITGYNLAVEQNMNSDMKKYNNFLTRTVWITDSILGLNPIKEKYKLTKYTTRKFAGNLTEFDDKLRFTSKYVAPCGNDYFTTVTGSYEFIDNNKIEVIVSTVAYSGEWEKPTEHRTPLKLIYSISKSENELTFIKE